jgi:hypothetical protein
MPNGTIANVPAANPEKPVELRQVKDHPIHGRIINTEGKPIAGVRVAVKILNIYAANSLQKAWKKHNFGSGLMPVGVKGLRPEEEQGGATSTAGVLLATMTDADGLFTLHGVGTEGSSCSVLAGPASRTSKCGSPTARVSMSNRLTHRFRTGSKD